MNQISWYQLNQRIYLRGINLPSVLFPNFLHLLQCQRYVQVQLDQSQKVLALVHTPCSANERSKQFC